MRAEATIISRGAAVEPSEPDRRASASAAARCRSRSSELLSAHCRSSKLRQTGWRVAISMKKADRARKM